ncbi:iron chelate uptake ABC transporter family permease subunit [Paenibacillus hexagrammi]|uniref:iron chelate uptake ABC transporter family permease subunit n=1 Tax=Paenibacillus hexagrammi TaxID=2908839 RepID=UPI002882FF71|nr:iron chelate uptake ABC transporter family permease subunit [Paenibacillus sp. YPD9-1]
MHINNRLEKQSRTWLLLFLFSATFVLLVVGILCSLKWGAAPISWQALYEALTYNGQEKSHLYIQTLRLPRTITAFMVGIQLALARLLTQLVDKKSARFSARIRN